jgi:hypothetical protein
MYLSPQPLLSRPQPTQKSKPITGSVSIYSPFGWLVLATETPSATLRLTPPPPHTHPFYCPCQLVLHAVCLRVR